MCAIEIKRLLFAGRKEINYGKKRDGRRYWEYNIRVRYNYSA